MARIAKTDIEARWYAVFSGWAKDDRASAIKVLTALHPRLPDKPSKNEPKQGELPIFEGRTECLRSS